MEDDIEQLLISEIPAAGTFLVLEPMPVGPVEELEIHDASVQRICLAERLVFWAISVIWRRIPKRA
jgi:hypothetical protein